MKVDTYKISVLTKLPKIELLFNCFNLVGKNPTITMYPKYSTPKLKHKDLE